MEELTPELEKELQSKEKVLVIDQGSFLTKIGVADLASPLIFPTSLLSQQISRNHYFYNGDSDSKEFWELLFNSISVLPEGRWVCLISPFELSEHKRKSLMKLFFEIFKVAGFYLLDIPYSSILGSWTSSKITERSLTGICVDVGYTTTRIIPSIDGHPDQDNIKVISVGGYDATQLVAHLLKTKKVEIPLFQLTEVVDEMKKKGYFYTAPDVVKEEKKYIECPEKWIKTYEGINKITKKPFVINLSHERYMAAECILNPILLKQYGLLRCKEETVVPLANLIHDVIQSCEIQYRRNLYDNIVLSGASTCFTDFYRHLQRDLQNLVYSKYKSSPNPPSVKIVSYAIQSYSSWFGGSVMGSSSLFKSDCALSKVRYEKFCGEDYLVGENSLSERQMLNADEHLVYKGALELINGFTPTSTCVNELMKLESEPGMRKIKYIVKECQKWLQSYISQPNSNPHNLTKDEMFAIGIYTFDLGVNGNQEENFYFQLNQMLKERNPQQISKIRGYLYFLQKALNNLPNECLMVYRGIPHVDVFREQYTKYRQIHWSAFSSTTPNKAKALQFAGTNGCVICISISTGKSIKSYSVFPTEDEILLSPNMSFVVTQTLYEEDGQLYVNLEQAKPEKKFIF